MMESLKKLKQIGMAASLSVLCYVVLASIATPCAIARARSSDVDTTSPTGIVIIDSGDRYTNSRKVNLEIAVFDDDPADVLMRVADSSAAIEGVGWQSLAYSLKFILSAGDGEKTVYAQFKDSSDNISQLVSDTIALDTKAPSAAITSPATTRHVRGVIAVRFFARDTSAADGTSSGIKAIRLYRDEKPIGVRPSSVRCAINTRKLKDGKHSIKISAYDHAGNRKIALRYFIVDNTRPNINNLRIFPIFPSVSTKASLFCTPSDKIARSLRTVFLVTSLKGSVLKKFDLRFRRSGVWHVKLMRMPSLPAIYVFKIIVKDPAGNQAIRQMRFTVTPNIIFHGNRGRKKVALTIDDGYNADERILRLLRRYNIKITVFPVGAYADKHPVWIRRLDSAGFEVANHTYNHPWLTRLSNREIAGELKKAQRIITRQTGKKFPYMRPPGGFYNQQVLNMVNKCGYKMVLWTQDLGGFRKGDTTARMIRNGLRGIKNGDIILCHFGMRHTYEALRTVIPELRRRGYKITTVSDVLMP